MNKRLVWNFELSSKNLLNWQELSGEIANEIRWEARFFWPEENIIVLDGLDIQFLTLSSYQIKQRFDDYFILEQYPYNIKVRRGQYLYKPLLKDCEGVYGYGKKINLSDYPANDILPGTNHHGGVNLLTELKEKGQKISISKEVLLYQWASTPPIKLELARFALLGNYYFSLSFAGRSHTLVSKLANQVSAGATPDNYVSFLKRILEL